MLAVCLKTTVDDEGRSGRPTAGTDDLAMKDDEEIRENRHLRVIYFYYSLLSLNYIDYRLISMTKSGFVTRRFDHDAELKKTGVNDRLNSRTT